MNFVSEESNSRTNKPAGENCLKISAALIHFGGTTDEDLKTTLDKIVGGIGLYLNNFIGLGKLPSRQHRLEETILSKLKGKTFLKNSSWQRRMWIFHFGRSPYYESSFASQFKNIFSVRRPANSY